MAIEFQCTCGKKLSVPDDAAGHKARCPGCGMVTTVPGTRVVEPEPVESRPEATSRVDVVMEQFMTDLAERRERAPQFTQIAIALALWAGISFVLTFLISTISSQYSLVLWILVWLPQCTTGGLIAFGMIKADHRTPKFAQVASLVIVGADWPLLWGSAIVAAGSAAGVLMLLISLGNMGCYGFLYWYFSRGETLALFAPKTEDAEGEPKEPKPAGGP